MPDPPAPETHDARDAVLAAWPDLFARERDMVVGTDIDALLSAAFLHDRYGWNVVGFYDLEKIHLAKGVTWERAREAYWVDLDIARADITSIGHHILTWGGPHEARLLAAHQRSLNPNLLRGISQGQFTRKYPLSTVFLLHWLAAAPIPMTVNALCLLWAADSSWKNMATYTANVRDWIQNWMPHPFLMATKEGWLQANYKGRMAQFTTTFNQNAPLTLASIVGSKGITDPAARPAGNPDTYIQLILNYVCGLMAWKTLIVPHDFDVIHGRRVNVDLGAFVPPDDLFSYVLPYRTTLNYTTFAPSDMT